MHGTTLTITVPSLRVSGQNLILSKLSLNVKSAGTAKKPFLRTPPSCPKSGSWMFSAAFSYTDGSSKSLSSASTCHK